jgi:molybdopterin converting factor small subunit
MRQDRTAEQRMTTELDSLTIRDFEVRYGIARSNVNNRIAGLKQKGYDLEPEKQDGKNIYNAVQIELMDQLDTHLKTGGTIATFPASDRPDEQSDLSYVSRDTSPSSYRTQDNPKLTYRTQDNSNLEPAPMAMTFAGVIDASAAKVVDVFEQQQSVDRLANLRAIEEAYEKGWQLSISQLAPLLGLKSLNGSEIQRFGFTFERVGRNGSESAWKITKSL